jgi:lipopolysaccharide/colanic/teichoic acid biosynthesis glycosyltransferase
MCAKRAMDVMVSLGALLLLAPLFVALAIAIRVESPGPAFFLQNRVGFHGRIFSIIKFRTMQANAPATGPKITIGADPRITRLGKVLRAFKFDELPQLINVLKGEMSLVGPRPEVPEFMALYSPEQRHVILSVRPGITDFASIEFSDEAAILASASEPGDAYVLEVMPKKFAHYKRYVEERSLLIDVEIIFKTIFKVLGQRG